MKVKVTIKRGINNETVRENTYTLEQLLAHILERVDSKADGPESNQRFYVELLPD